jgi:hypothetical protein
MNDRMKEFLGRINNPQLRKTLEKDLQEIEQIASEFDPSRHRSQIPEELFVQHFFLSLLVKYQSKKAISPTGLALQVALPAR